MAGLPRHSPRWHSCWPKNKEQIPTKVSKASDSSRPRIELVHRVERILGRKPPEVENVEVEEVGRIEAVEAIARGQPTEKGGCNLSVLLRVDAEFFHPREESGAIRS